MIKINKNAIATNIPNKDTLITPGLVAGNDIVVDSKIELIKGD